MAALCFPHLTQPLKTFTIAKLLEACRLLSRQQSFLSFVWGTLCQPHRSQTHDAPHITMRKPALVFVVLSGFLCLRWRPRKMDGFTCSFCGSTCLPTSLSWRRLVANVTSSCSHETNWMSHVSSLFVMCFFFPPAGLTQIVFPRAQCINNASTTDPATPLKFLATGNKVVWHLCLEGDVTLSMSVS